MNILLCDFDTFKLFAKYNHTTIVANTNSFSPRKFDQLSKNRLIYKWSDSDTYYTV